MNKFYMKTISTNSYSLIKAFVLLVVLGLSSISYAQAPFKGGTTYYVDGVGTDVVAPKDTFVDLMGSYSSGAYGSTTGIFSAINANGVDPATIGTINIILCSGYSGTESTPIQLGDPTIGAFNFMSSNKPIVVKPASGVNVTLTTSAVSSQGAVFRLTGVQYFTLDGQGTAGQKNITIMVPTGSTSSSIRVVDVLGGTQNGCQSITVKNCVIVGNSTNALSGVVNTMAGFYIGGASAPSNPIKRSQNISIESNDIMAVQYGVYARGIGGSSQSQDKGLKILNNTIGGSIAPGDATLPTTYVGGLANAAGIYLSAQANSVVTGNIIRNSLPGYGGFAGILLTGQAGTASLDSSIVINGNKIYNHFTFASTSGSYGIRISLGVHGSNPLGITISNNTIAGISATNGSSSLSSMSYPIGISVEDNTSNMGLGIYHNSINLYGDTLTGGGVSAAVSFAASVTGGVSAVNNIFVNRMGRPMAAIVGNPSSSYGIVLNGSTSPFTGGSLTNNAYYVTNFTGSYSYVGYFNNRSRPTVAELSLALAATSDAQVASIPPFTNDSTLVIANNAGTKLYNMGIPVGGITTDINGNARSASTPSLGAYEFSGNVNNSNVALNGGSTYSINGVNSWPTVSNGTGTFATVADAMNYLNVYGVSGAGVVKIQLASGYAGETRFIPAVTAYTGASAATPVTLTVAAGNNVLVTTPNSGLPNYYSVFRTLGARYFTIDGSNNGSSSRNLTIALPSNATNVNSRVISIHSSDTLTTLNLTIKNCIITGNSTSSAVNTFAGIYHGAPIPSSGAYQSSMVGRNSVITLQNNAISGVRNGIYARGAAGAGNQNTTWTIASNVIGGIDNTTYIGGAGGASSGNEDQAGIYVKGTVMSSIDGNTIRNTIPVGSSGFKGIDLNAGGEAGTDSAITISRNLIYNLRTTYQYCAGIKVSLGSDSLRAISIVNNSIAKIRGIGGGASFATVNPVGIFIDGTGSVKNVGVAMYNNTIQLTGSTLISGSASNCIFINTPVTGGVTMKANILYNTLGRLSGSGDAYAVQMGTAATSSTPFTLPTGASDYNTYYVNAPSSNSYIGVSGTGSTRYTNIGDWRNFTKQDVYSYFYGPIFQNDTMPDIDPAGAGIVYNGSPTTAGITVDIYGNARSGTFTNIGAVQFNQTFVPLAGGGVYQINGVQSPPTPASPTTGSFATIKKAIEYINANGVDNIAAPVNPIKLVISAGYPGEDDAMITPLFDYPRMNANRPIILSPGAGRNDVITTAGIITPYGLNSSVIRFAGGSYFTIDGSNNGTSSRNLTIMLPTSATDPSIKVIDVTSANVPVTGVTIKNCNIIGNSTTSAINTFAGIYMGSILQTPEDPNLAGNNNNTFQNNFIGGVRNGIYVRGLSATGTGAVNQQDVGTTIKSNIIGGTVGLGDVNPTNYFGGADKSAGIFLSAQSKALVDSNVIQNNIPSFKDNKGIELSAVSGDMSVDSAITVSRNIISKIKNTTATGGAYGLVINLGSIQSRNLSVNTNMISSITAPGTPGALMSTANPIGILVDGVGAVANLGLSLYYNSVNLGLDSTVIAGVGASSAAIYFNGAIKGGVASKNNIFQNTLGRTSASGAGNAYAMVVGSNASIFTASDNNNYFVNAPNSTNQVAITNAINAPVVYRTSDTLSNFTLQDTFSMSFVTRFTNDSNLFIPTGASPVYGSAAVITGLTKDIKGTPRSISFPSIGAHEFSGTYADSIAPKVYNVTGPINCSNGSFKIVMRVIERNVAIEALKYSVNGGAVQTATSAGASGYNRTFTIPAQSANSSIAYYYTITDGSTFSYNATTSNYYLSTIRNTFPLVNGFDLPNTQGWSVQQVNGVGGWNLDTYGSANQPILGAQTGLKAALFPAATLPAGTTSRLVSPCMDLGLMKVPTLRFWISQNADVATVLDSIGVRVGTPTSTITNGWSQPLRTLYRVNTSLAFPGYTMVDVCLSNYVSQTIKIGIEATAKGGGNNMVLDSIMVFDDILNLPVTPSTANICLYDSVSLTIGSASSNYSYKFVNIFSGADFSAAKNGNNGNLNIQASNQGLDSIYLQIRYTNIGSGCTNLMDDTTKVYVHKFTNGPFLSKGTPFTGNYNAGSVANPDAGKFGDVMTYAFTPPSGYTNAQYGTKWTIVNQSIKTQFGTSATSSTFHAPTSSIAGSYVLNPAAADGDSTFILKVTFRLMGSNCDSTITRRIKVTSAPTVTFITAPSSGTICANVNMSFTNTGTYAPSTGPVTYLWDFGDGVTANTENAIHQWSTAGSYTVTYTTTNSAGIATSATKAITVLASPDASFSYGTVCSGSPTLFSNASTGGSTNSWTFMLNGTTEGTSSNASPTYQFINADTNYIVRLVVSNAQSCRDTAVQQVYTFPKPTASFTTLGHCLGTNVAVVNTSSISTTKPNSSFGSEWDFNGVTVLSNQPTYTFPSSGTFPVKLRVTTNFGCKDSFSSSITVYDKPHVDYTLTNTCQSDVMMINNNTTYVGGTNKLLYDWNFGDNTPNSNAAVPTKVYGATGNFNVKLVVQDTVNFCKDSLTKPITVYTTPIAAFDAPNGCVGTELTFRNNSATTSSDTYAWDFRDGGTSTAFSPVHTYNGANTYNVMLVVTTVNNCKDTALKLLSVTAPPVVSYTKVQDASPTDSFYIWHFDPNPKNMSLYTWDFGDGTKINNQTDGPVSNKYDVKGWHVVTLTVTDANGCKGTKVDSVLTTQGVGLDNQVAAQFKLNIAPNPFTDRTNVNFTLQSTESVKVSVFDLMGRNVAEINAGELTSGNHAIELNASKFSSTSGAYIVRIEIGGTVISRQIIQAK